MSGNKSSGIYIIDSLFNIVSFNEPMKEKYPLIRKNEKCFKVLMNGAEPCTFCPVANKINGPCMYTDPVRQVKETIDAIEIPLSDGRIGYAMVFSSVLDLSEIDELTGLYTREAFFRYAQRLIDTSPDAEFDMFIVDIEAFRNVNRKYGEKVGDRVLQALADFIKTNTPDGICARLNSDLFVGIRPRQTGYGIEGTLRLTQEFIENAPVPGLVLKNGIYENIDKTLPVSQICDRTILALKSIKNKHSRNVALYDGPISQQLQRDQDYESIFRNAIEQKEFEVFYQPKYEPFTEHITGAEALVRWVHDGKMMFPGDFLPVFEANGMISRLDEYVFREVCEFQRRRREAGQALIPVSVNVSRESMFDSEAPRRYRQIAEENGISPADVPIEITESAAVGGAEIKPIADAFTEAGFSLHIDDFGSGRSSLNDLNLLSIDVVKLDRSLISCIGDTRGELLLAHTITLGKALGLPLIAEGVEYEQQLNFLKENGCDYIQGYYYSRPLPEAEFEKKVSETR